MGKENNIISTKKTIALFLFIMMLNLHVFAQLSGDTFREAKAKGQANITYTYVETPGFVSKNSTGEISGLCVDIMKEFVKYVEQKEQIKAKLNFKGISDHDNFKLFMSEIKNSQGGVFGLGNITITAARKKTYHFSPPFISNLTILLTHTDVPSLNDISEIGTTFKGLKAYAVKGTTNEQQILAIKQKYMPSLEIRHVSSSVEVLEKVVNDPKSFTNLDFTYYLAILKQRKPIKRHQAGDLLTEEFGIIMPKSNDWAPILKEFFDTGFIDGPVYRKIIARHLGPNALKLLDSFKK